MVTLVAEKEIKWSFFSGGRVLSPQRGKKNFEWDKKLEELQI